MSAERRAALRRAIARYADAPFERSSDGFDCVQFARAVIREVTGESVADDATYANAAEADQIIEDHGGMKGLISYYLGETVNVDELRLADIALVNLEGIPTLVGVVASDSKVLVPMPRGLVGVPMSAVLSGWRV